MAQIKKKDRIEYVWKIIMAGGFLTLLSITLPSAAFVEAGVWVLLWHIGILWGGDVYGGETIGFIEDDRYMPIGVATTVLLIIALILMAIAAFNTKNEKKLKLNAGISLFGGVLAIISPIVYYYYLEAEIPALFWNDFVPIIGVFLPIIAGILGIMGSILVGYNSKHIKQEKTF